MCIYILCTEIMQTHSARYELMYVCMHCVLSASLPFTSQAIITESTFDRRVIVLPRAVRVLNRLQSQTARKMWDGEIEREIQL